MSLPPELPLGFKPRGSFFINPEDAQCQLSAIADINHHLFSEGIPFGRAS
jgi:hypothetical protein